MSSNNPAILRTKNKMISNISFSKLIDPPIKEKGTDPIKYGINNLWFRFPAFM